MPQRFFARVPYTTKRPQTPKTDRRMSVVIAVLIWALAAGGGVHDVEIGVFGAGGRVGDEADG
jgi:hypothetical protein